MHLALCYNPAFKQIEWVYCVFNNDLPSLQDESVKQTAQLMYQTALLESGFQLSDSKDFASRIYNTVKSGLNISPDAGVEEEDEAEEIEAENDTKEAAATPKAEDEADIVKDEL